MSRCRGYHPGGFAQNLKADKTFRDEEHRKMWLIRVTVNTIKSNVTSAWRRHTVALDDVTEPSYEASDLPVLKEKVEKLPERYHCQCFFITMKSIGKGDCACDKKHGGNSEVAFEQGEKDAQGRIEGGWLCLRT